MQVYGSNSREEFEEVFKLRNEPGIWFVNAFRLNDRLAAQQGAFVLPLDVTKSLTENILASQNDETDFQNQLRFYTIEVNTIELKKCLKELHRMNINRATLYPGIVGLAQNLENAVGMPHLFEGVDGDLSRPL